MMEGNTPSRLNNPVVDKKMKIVWANEIIIDGVKLLILLLSLNQELYISY